MPLDQHLVAHPASVPSGTVNRNIRIISSW